MLNKILRSESAASVLDQGVVSGGNFLTTLVLARALVPETYGLFALLFLSLIAINACHSSLVVYPLTLRGAASPRELGSLTYASLVHTLLLAVPLSGVLAVIVIVLHRPGLFPVMALAMLSWQVQETTRRALISVLRFRSTIFPDALCYLGQGIILAVLKPQSLSTVFWIVSVTSLAAAAWQLVLARRGSVVHRRDLRMLTITHGAYSWRMGRFVLAGNALNMLTLQIPSWTLAIAFAPAAVAGYQSLLNLVGVANPIIFSINSMLIPTVAREAVHGFRSARRTAARYGVRFGLLLIPGFLALFCAPSTMMRWVYGHGSPYLPLAWLLRFFVVAFVLQYLATVVGAYEGGMSRPKNYMWLQAMGTGFLLILGSLKIYKFGIAGAVIAMLLASAIRLVTFLLLAHIADKSAAAIRPVLADSFAGRS